MQGRRIQLKKTSHRRGRTLTRRDKTVPPPLSPAISAVQVFLFFAFSAFFLGVLSVLAVQPAFDAITPSPARKLGCQNRELALGYGRTGSPFLVEDDTPMTEAFDKLEQLWKLQDTLRKRKSRRLLNELGVLTDEDGFG